MTISCDVLTEGLAYCPARLLTTTSDEKSARAEAASEGWEYNPTAGTRGEDYCPYHAWDASRDPIGQ